MQRGRAKCSAGDESNIVLFSDGVAKPFLLSETTNEAGELFAVTHMTQLVLAHVAIFLNQIII